MRLKPLFALLICAALFSSTARAVDYLPGDANDDGSVTFADAFSIASYLFMNRSPSSCSQAMDIDQSGAAGLVDAVYIMTRVVFGSEPNEVFPPVDLIADPDCDSYSGTATVDSEGSHVKIHNAQAPGGDDRTVTLRLEIANPVPIAGYQLRMSNADSLITHVGEPKDLTGTIEAPNYNGRNIEDDALYLGFLTSFISPASIPASNGGVDVLEFEICLAAGTPAGDYPLTIEFAELVTGCVGTDCQDAGGSISPEIHNGTLHVESAIGSEVECELGTDPEPEPETPVEATFSVGGGSFVADQEVTLPMIINATANVEGFSFSLDFDESVIQFIDLRENFVDHGTANFWQYHIDNHDNNEGSGGVDEGFVVGAGVASFIETPDTIPPNEDVEVVYADVRIAADAAPQESELVFVDGGRFPGAPPVRNSVVAYGRDITPQSAPTVLFVDAVLNILPDVSVFIRGDANRDDRVDISDAMHTLAHLFLGRPASTCEDAADADDDGRLLLTDAVFTLNYLFDRGSALPPPQSSPGLDPTPDNLTCFPAF
ncbi:MAG: hypothetical protein AAF517_00900 [Planctomycetota bacterium]